MRCRKLSMLTYLNGVKSLLNISNPLPLDSVLICFTTLAPENHELLGEAAVYRAIHRNAATPRIRTSENRTSEPPILPSFGMQPLERLPDLLSGKSGNNFLYCWHSEISVIYAKHSILLNIGK